MARIDWDWPAQLDVCKERIVELEAGIASQEQKIRVLLKAGMNAQIARRLLAIRQESLARVRCFKRLIEIRIADGAAEEHAADLMRLLAKLERPKGENVKPWYLPVP